MIKPDYNGAGIVNLMASIAGRFGHRTGHRELQALPVSRLHEYRTIVLIVLDGLGYEYLTTRGGGSFLRSHLRSRMTSVFPSTTASCVTTFATGATPAEHGVTGWFTHLPELGTVAKILFAEPRIGAPGFNRAGIDFRQILLARPLFDRMQTKSFVITPRFIAQGDFSRATSGRAEVITYSTVNGFFNGIRKALRDRHSLKFISAYWPEFDHRCHHQGVTDPRTEAHFWELDGRIERLTSQTRGSGTLFLVTADHGLIDTPRTRYVELNRHPELARCLTLPLCGEPRAAYCYVRPDRVSRFTAYVRTRLREQCALLSREQLIERGFYGTARPDPRFEPRVGDFALMMRDNWCIKDFLVNEDEVFLKANHGGTTSQEMYVPLIVLGDH